MTHDEEDQNTTPAARAAAELLRRRRRVPREIAVYLFRPGEDGPERDPNPFVVVQVDQTRSPRFRRRRL